MKYRLIYVLLAIFIHVSLTAQTDTLIVKRWKNNKPIAMLTAESKLYLTCSTATSGSTLTVSYNNAHIKSVADSFITVSYNHKYMQRYDSTQYLKTDSSVRCSGHDSDIVDTIYIHTISKLGVDRNTWVEWLIIPATIGCIVFFAAPFIAKTTSAGQLNTALYYPLLVYGVISVLSTNYLFVKSAFGPSSMPVCGENPAQKKSRCVYIDQKQRL